MASTATWNAGPSIGRRRLRAAAGTLLLTVALALTLAASAAGVLAWGLARAGTPVDGGGGPAVATDDPSESPSEASELPPGGTSEVPAVEPSPEAPVPAEDPAPPEDVTPVEPVDDPATEPDDEADTAAGNDDEDDDAADEGAEPELSTAEVQQTLRDHGFLIAVADGTAGQQTTAAVMAFQRVNGLAVDGVVGPETTAALLAGSAEPTLAGGAADRVEVDLDRQLLHLVEGGQRTVTLQVSSGNGATYTNARGQARARTPVGAFVVERRVHGLREAALGTLYDPLYFYGGFAIHGSPSVPAHPASHGCVRVTRADAAWLIERVPDGMPVQLYGGTHVFAP